MKVAYFSDIHGNIGALEAVLADIQKRRVDMVFCGGDLVGYGAFPNEVIGLIREQHIPTIMGNYDWGIGNDSDDCGCAYRDELSKALGKRSIAWTREKVTPENKAYLRNLLRRISFRVRDREVLLVHGSPRRINEYLFQDRPIHSIIKMFREEKVDVIVCGHTHKPYYKEMIVEETSVFEPGGHYVLINGGSVGMPKDSDPRAAYALLDFTESALRKEIIRVPYDVETMARAVEQSSLPVEYAAMLRQATG
ncbi:MAG: metallophosphoesterase family protein [Candidatus Saccharicenans sp.]|uniref:metallophosphoesterase family protein n=1 Tax=Candidatus Saccharicenans sp. TaxID=2819258 RepID=UPI004049FE48